MDAAALPVTVLTGFLGTGKTTLLNRLLRAEHGMRLGVLVNDFGAINIDARLVDFVDGDDIALTNGCVCCSMRGDLMTALKRVAARPSPPEHLIVEASGIADPAAIASIFRTPTLRERVRLDGVITLVDAENARNPRLDQVLIREQIRSADIAVLNKIDLVSSETCSDVASWIRSLSPGIRIAQGVNADVPFQLLVGLDGARLSDSARDSGHGHHTPFGTWSYRTDHPLAYRKLREALESLPDSIFRAKGILALADAPNLRFIAQLVGRRLAVDAAGLWGDAMPRTELVFIGTPNALEEDSLISRFDACATDSIVLMSRQNLARLKGAASRRAHPAHR